MFMTVISTVKSCLNGRADGVSSEVMGQSCKIILAVNQKEILAGFGGFF